VGVDSTEPNDRAGSELTFSENYKRGVLGLLLLAYTFNFIDRTIINTIGQAIKEDLRLTDTELGLLGGLAFAVCYTLLGIPIARLADRSHRVNIIALSIAAWSAFTAACGAVQNYSQLLLMRVGVGVGEAGLSPPAHSLISDYYEPHRRASALSVYGLGIPLGVMFGAVAGGWIADNFSWRTAYLLVGFPGLLVAVLAKVFVKEPPRGHSDHRGATSVVADEDRHTTLWAVIRTMFASWGLVHLVAGCTLVSLAAYGTATYSQAFFIRQFGVSYTLVGLIFGVIGGLSSGLGTLLGGWLADWRGKTNPKWYALVPGIGVTIALPLYVLVFTRYTWQSGAWLLVLPGIFHCMYIAPTWGLVQNVMPGPMRATAAALLLFIVNIFGLGLGPPICGWLIDTFSASLFNARGLGEFAVQCPGGIGLEGVLPQVDAACRASVSLGTRWGILVTLGFFAWGALHYYAAALTLPKDLFNRFAAKQPSR
jgi:predicted MFS family arabinose efflux permease